MSRARKIADMLSDYLTDLQALPDPNVTIISDSSVITGGTSISNILAVTQAEYDAIVTPDALTLYVIVP